MSPRSVRYLGTADVKADEPGLLAAAAGRGWPVVTFPASRLAAVPVPNPSEVVPPTAATPRPSAMQPSYAHAEVNA